MRNSVSSIVPARSGSKSIRNKNLSLVGGMPLLVRSLVHAMQVIETSKPILTSDSWEYADVAHNFLLDRVDTLESPKTLGENFHDFGSFLFHLRSSYNSDDKATLPNVIREVQSNLEQLGNQSPRAWLILQPTSPFRSSAELRYWRELCNEATEESSFVSIVDVNDYHPARMYTVGDQGQLHGLGLYPEFEVSPRQALPAVYIRDGGFYLVGRSLISRGVQVGKSPIGVIRAMPWSINIDSQEDLLLAEAAVELLSESEF